MQPRGARHPGTSKSRLGNRDAPWSPRLHAAPRPCLARRTGWTAIAALLPLHALADAPAPLYLSPIVDGVAKPGVVSVLAVPGGVLVTPDALKALGLVPGTGQPGPGGERLIPPSGATAAVIDMQAQVIRFTVPAGDLIATLMAVSTPAVATPAQSGTGAFLNYAASVTPPSGEGPTATKLSLAADLSGALFSPAGYLNASSLLQMPKPGSGESEFTRLNTTYEFDQPEIPLAARAGDLTTAPPGWGRAEFLGGVQLASDYDLQPSRPNFPTPIIGQTLAQPSDIALLVNNVAAYSGNADAGPLALVGIPVINGLNEVTIQTRSATGQVSSQTVPFYASSTMLAPGLTTFNASAGELRHNYGETDNFYATPVFDTTLSHGLTNTLTLTTHSEVAGNLALLGGGFETTGAWGDLAAAYALSMHQAFDTHARQAGRLYSAQYTRASPRFGIAAGIVNATSGYDDLGIETNAAYPILSWHVSGTAALPGRAGNIALAYTEQSAERHSRDGFILASFSTSLFGRLNFTMSCFRGDVRAFGASTANMGCNAGLSVSLGSLGTAGGSAAFGTAQRPEYGQTLQEAPAGIQGFGASAGNFMGDYLSRTLRAQAVTRDADIAANIAQNGAAYSSEVDLSGSLIAMDGLYVSRPTNNAFAVVDFGYPNIPVFLSNQPVGSTGGSGRMLIPGLVPNYPNRLSIDAAAVPLNIEIGDNEIVVVPPRVGGVLVRFPTQKLNAAYLSVRLRSGARPPAGSLLYLQGSQTPIVVGYDGYVYIENAPRHLSATIIMSTGHCFINTTIVVSVHNAVVGRPVTCGG